MIDALITGDFVGFAQKAFLDLLILGPILYGVRKAIGESYYERFQGHKAIWLHYLGRESHDGEYASCHSGKCAIS